MVIAGIGSGVRVRNSVGFVAVTVVVLVTGLLSGVARGQENQPPSAVITPSATTVDVGAFVALHAIDSSDTDGVIVEYTWDFGDRSPLVSGGKSAAEQVYHAFRDPGAYQVSLVATDDGGARSAPATVTIVVGIDPSLTVGASLFTTECGPCHTPGNIGGRGLTTEQLIASMTTGLMRAQGARLSPEQVDAVAEFIVRADEAPPGLGVTTTTVLGDDASPARMYSALCAGCHGGGGEGGLGPSLQVSTLTESDILTILRDGVGTMLGYSGSLSDPQIRSIARYVPVLQTPGATTTTTTIPSTTDGGQLYAALCVSCHGEFGQGLFGPSLQAVRLDADATAGVVRDGIGYMSGYGGLLSDEQIAAVSAFSVAFQTGQPAVPPPVASEPEPSGPIDPAAGEPIYAANCAACHGPAGEGGVGPALQTSTFDFATTKAAITNGVGAMPGLGATMSPEELDAVTAFSVSLSGGEIPSGGTGDAGDDGDAATAGGTGGGDGAAPPREVSPEAKALFAANCAICHGESGEGASAAPLNQPFETSQLKEIIAVGIGAMPGFAGTLSDEEIDQVAAFVHSVAVETAPTTTVAGERSSIVAIQPSRFVEFEEAAQTVPLDVDAQIAFALGTLGLLLLIVFLFVREERRDAGHAER